MYPYLPNTFSQSIGEKWKNLKKKWKNDKKMEYEKWDNKKMRIIHNIN